MRRVMAWSSGVGVQVVDALVCTTGGLLGQLGAGERFAEVCADGGVQGRQATDQRQHVEEVRGCDVHDRAAPLMRSTVRSAPKPSMPASRVSTWASGRTPFH